MKKWIVYVLMFVFAAGFAVAKDKAPWWKLGFGGDDKEQITTDEAPPPSPVGRPDRSNARHRQKTSFEKQMEMKAEDEEIKSLVAATRSEIDPVKKAELTEQIRAKLTDRAGKRMQAKFHKRLRQAEVDVVEMRERLKQRDEEMSRRVEEQLQKLLSGQPLERGGPMINQRHR